MSIQMRGAEVAKAMKEKLIREREELNAAGVNPCLTIIRVGAKENDLAYERGAKKRMEMIGIECRIAERQKIFHRKNLRMLSVRSIKIRRFTGSFCSSRFRSSSM